MQLSPVNSAIAHFFYFLLIMYRKFFEFFPILVWIGESEHAKDESSPWWRDVTLLAQHTLGIEAHFFHLSPANPDPKAFFKNLNKNTCFFEAFLEFFSLLTCRMYVSKGYSSVRSGACHLLHFFLILN